MQIVFKMRLARLTICFLLVVSCCIFRAESQSSMSGVVPSIRIARHHTHNYLAGTISTKHKSNGCFDCRGGSAHAARVSKTMTARRMETLKYV
jgi:hypothetical protein